MKIVMKRLKSALDLTAELVYSMKPTDLKLKLKDMPSNTIGEQLWCVIGARESYLKAIMNGSWVGFSCSLMDTTSLEQIIFHLNKSSEDIFDYLRGTELNEKQEEFMLILLEHEVLHHGQFIRYVYGNKLPFPKSWNKRYNV